MYFPDDDTQFMFFEAYVIGDVKGWRHQWRRLQKTYIWAPSSSHPVTLLEEPWVGNRFPWVGALTWGKEGNLFREQEPRHPLIDIPLGYCTLLLGDLGIFIFLVRQFIACLSTILPHCIFFVRKNCHIVYPIWRSPILICLN